MSKLPQATVDNPSPMSADSATTRGRARGLFVAGMFAPAAAWAQAVTLAVAWTFFFAPLAAIVLAIVLGALLRSWQHAALGMGAVFLWASWFWAAGQTTTTDIFFWIPVVAVQIQILATLAWVVCIVYRRASA